MKLKDIFSKKSNEGDDIKMGSEAFRELFGTAGIDRMVQFVDDLSMDVMAQIFAEAKTGSINRLIHAYIQMEHSDSRLQGLINARRNASAGMEWSVTSGDSDESIRAAGLVEHCLDRLDMNNLVRDFLDGRFYGVALFEKIWSIQQYENKRVALIESIQQIDHSTIEMDMHSLDEKFGKLFLLMGLSQELYLDEIHPRKLVRCINTTKKGYHDLSGVLRTVARWNIIKTYAIKLWMQSAETHGHPTTIVKVNKKDFDKQKKVITRLLKAVGVNRYGIFFDNMSYETHATSDAGSIAIFKEMIDLCNTEMAIAVVGQNLSSEVQGGSYAAAETHKEILMDTVQDDLKWLEHVFNMYLVRDLVEVNYPGLDESEYPVFTPFLKKHVNRAEVARGLNEASRLVAIPQKWVYEQLQIPVPEKDEETISSTTRGLFDEIDRA